MPSFGSAQGSNGAMSAPQSDGFVWPESEPPRTRSLVSARMLTELQRTTSASPPNQLPVPLVSSAGRRGGVSIPVSPRDEQCEASSLPPAHSADRLQTSAVMRELNEQIDALLPLGKIAVEEGNVSLEETPHEVWEEISLDGDKQGTLLPRLEASGPAWPSPLRVSVSAESLDDIKLSPQQSDAPRKESEALPPLTPETPPKKLSMPKRKSSRPKFFVPGKLDEE
ncbi:hypothetical protein GGTG_04976 [Gaeumannomyces tritici R3-111a-1]|uniref:Uncharacterized protein n=1 Tax=Gaeumannomyces tritici (strain R3-111a-1) TaxID=644352 RepID=J3NUM1_GAET3|nr:hypothetical protein GGTG_04976 [Gaeumannomyces tritici R3-111a-1]EJT79894.1 hypothetical protein GGTG_04976 [Gaeumannomyces tritici R3-111a-1]